MMLIKKQIRFGILGCGVIADYHAQAIKSLDNAELVGVADLNAERAAIFAEKYGVKSYPNDRQMLDDPSIDAVCI